MNPAIDSRVPEHYVYPFTELDMPREQQEGLRTDSGVVNPLNRAHRDAPEGLAADLPMSIEVEGRTYRVFQRGGGFYVRDTAAHDKSVRVASGEKDIVSGLRIYLSACKGVKGIPGVAQV